MKTHFKLKLFYKEQQCANTLPSASHLKSFFIPLLSFFNCRLLSHFSLLFFCVSCFISYNSFHPFQQHCHLNLFYEYSVCSMCLMALQKVSFHTNNNFIKMFLNQFAEKKEKKAENYSYTSIPTYYTDNVQTVFRYEYTQNIQAIVMHLLHSKYTQINHNNFTRRVNTISNKSVNYNNFMQTN